MADTLLLFRTDFGAPDVTAAVNLHGIGGDDAPTKGQGKIDGRIAFAGRRGTCDDDKRRFSGCVLKRMKAQG